MKSKGTWIIDFGGCFGVGRTEVNARFSHAFFPSNIGGMRGERNQIR